MDRVVVKPGVPPMGPHMGYSVGYPKKMQTIIFLKRLGVSMGLLGGYRALGGRNVAFREKEFPKWPCQ